MKVRLETNQAKTTNLEDNFKQINKIDNSLARPTKKREREDSNFHDQEWHRGGTASLVLVVPSPSCVQLQATPWTAARQASLSLTISRSLPKFMSIESVMPSNHIILCRPLLLLPSIFPSIRVFSNESLCIRWPKYWNFSFSISPSNEDSGLIWRLTGLISLLSKRLSRVFSRTTVQKHQFFSTLPSL